MKDYEKRLQDVADQVEETDKTGCNDGLLDALDDLSRTPIPKETEMRDYDSELREAVGGFLQQVGAATGNADILAHMSVVGEAYDNVKGKPTAVSLVGKICVFDGQKHSDGHLEYENGWADAVLEFRKQLGWKDE